LGKTGSSNGRYRLKIFPILIALCAYPALIHLCFAVDCPFLINGAWLVASAVGLGVVARRGLALLILFFGLLVLTGVALWWWGSIVDLVHLPPVLINLALMAMLGRSLLPGPTLLVARVASLWRGPLDGYQLRYCCLSDHEHPSFRDFRQLLPSKSLRRLAR
jgi:uncharacterized membrane protein